MLKKILNSRIKALSEKELKNLKGGFNPCCNLSWNAVYPPGALAAHVERVTFAILLTALVFK